MNLTNVETEELSDRYATLILEYKQAIDILVPALEKFGRIRNELQIITVELSKRNVDLSKLDKEYKLEENIKR